MNWVASVRLLLAGDVMLGRLVDQLFSSHVHHPQDTAHVLAMKQHHPHRFQNISFAYPWGSMLSYFHSSHLNIINLETAITTHPKPFPNKVFNFRMHPDNIGVLKAAHIGHVSLANNHVLDFGMHGLQDTMDTLNHHAISYAGVGSDQETAHGPTYLTVQVPVDTNTVDITFAFFSASDHPAEWSHYSQFNYLDIKNINKTQLSHIENQIQRAKEHADMVVFSLHWGPNYAWNPDPRFIEFAHTLIDAGVDIIHGHSSHHVQAVEVYKERPILYGCGDFIDDYAVDEAYRNDLGFLYGLDVDFILDDQGKRYPKFRHMDLIPAKIEYMQVYEMKDIQDQKDKMWLFSKMKNMCRTRGTSVQETTRGWLGIDFK